MKLFSGGNFTKVHKVTLKYRVFVVSCVLLFRFVALSYVSVVCELPCRFANGAKASPNDCAEKWLANFGDACIIGFSDHCLFAQLA